MNELVKSLDQERVWRQGDDSSGNIFRTAKKCFRKVPNLLRTKTLIWRLLMMGPILYNSNILDTILEIVQNSIGNFTLLSWFIFNFWKYFKSINSLTRGKSHFFHKPISSILGNLTRSCYPWHPKSLVPRMVLLSDIIRFIHGFLAFRVYSFLTTQWFFIRLPLFSYFAHFFVVL